MFAGAELQGFRRVVAEEERRALDEFNGVGLGGEGRRWVEVGCVDEAAADAELVELALEGAAEEAVAGEGEVGLFAGWQGFDGGRRRQGLEGAVDVVVELLGLGVVGEGVVAPGGGGRGGGGGGGARWRLWGSGLPRRRAG